MSQYQVEEMKEKRKEDKTFQDTIQDFLHVVSEGSICVYNVCQQTWSRDQVTAVKQLQPIQYQDLLIECCTGYKSFENREWVCNTCQRDLYSSLVPKLSNTNKMEFPT